MTTGSSIITTLGAGSGIDMGKLASDLAMAQYQARKNQLTARTEKVTNQISLASQLRNTLSTLASSFGDRVRTGDLAPAAQVANPGVASATLASGFTGKGTYSLEVSALARGQTLASPAFPSATKTFGAGALTVSFGKMDGSAFIADASHAALTITVPEGATLENVANLINTANAGVTAYVANGSAGAQLVFKGAEGQANGFTLSAAEDVPGSGLADLAWEPVTGASSQLTQTSQDAAFKLDGLAMTSASNKTAQVVPGVSLTLAGTNVGNPTNISFIDRSSTIPGVMQDMIGALNELANQVREATDALAGGELNLDSGARSLKAQLSRLTNTVIMPNAPDGAPRTLSDLGMKIERDGSFSLDGAKLLATIGKSPEGTTAMFTTGLYGIYGTLDKLSRDASKASDPGTLAGSIARYQKLSVKLDKDTSKLTEQQETLRQQLVTRFAKTDSRVAASQSTLSFLQAQIDAWNSSRN